MHLVPLPALADNYIWLIHDDEGMAIVVDPGDAEVVEKALAQRQLTLRAILLTHHHPDHTGGVAELRRQHRDTEVFAPVDERIGEATARVHAGDCIALSSPRLQWDVIAVPGHTLSHVAYAGNGLLLCGDTLFSMGCGRIFEGTPTQMLDSLDRLATLPIDTQVCGGHEYTETNGRFAITIDPQNPELHQRRSEVASLRAAGKPTLPVSLATELATNPFLRVNSPAIVDWCRQHGSGNDRVACFAALRGAKDTFR